MESLSSGGRALLSLEPSSSFSLFNVNYLMLWALWSCGRRAGVVQAQRQIHRALAGQLRTYALRRTRMLIRLIHFPPMKIGRERSSLGVVVTQLTFLLLS